MFGSIVITVFNNQSNILGEFYEKSRPFNYNLFLLEKSGYVGHFSTLFRKYWSDCPYPILLVTDEYQQMDKQYVFTQVIQKNDTWQK